MNSQTDWLEYNEWNRRDEKMSSIWVEPLAAWLGQNGFLKQDMAILDYGCGYFDLGEMIHRQVGWIEGYDPFSSGIEIAKEQLKTAKNIALYSSFEQIPAGKFDLIICNSVIQYMNGKEEFQDFLQRAGNFLRGESGKMLLSDLIPRNYSPALDALENLLFSVTRGIMVPMLIHLWRAATKPSKFQLFKIDPGELNDFANDAGFSVRFLPQNLTPSKRRYAALLHKG